jgi:hypothetical protein
MQVHPKKAQREHSSIYKASISPGPNPRNLDLKIKTIPEELSEVYCQYLDDLIMKFLESGQQSSTRVADGFAEFKQALTFNF